MTDAYDVNVSPDKRTILLHDQGPMLESVRVRLGVPTPDLADVVRLH